MSSAAGEAKGVGTGRGSRLPRWTRQEILVLIEGKRVVERSGRGRGRGRAARAAGAGAAGDGGGGAEPTKWAAVAEYCRRHGVDRGPVQCRKRWSNLAGDYKKIREWERAAAAAGEASFWAMRNDARRERRLPGFFDREVYEILEGRAVAPTGNAAAAARPVAVDVESKAEVAAAIGGGRGAEAAGLFSSSEDEDDQEDDAATPSPTATPIATPVATPAPAAFPVSGELRRRLMCQGKRAPSKAHQKESSRSKLQRTHQRSVGRRGSAVKTTPLDKPPRPACRGSWSRS
ncbi:unnamed protein product [Urochloa decumbens]|uniref:Myb-like domain-containing protein n=1 Tax=Urochloa decumbens TaxID=240449 RepID=A0ABC9CXY9_9POAL